MPDTAGEGTDDEETVGLPPKPEKDGRLHPTEKVGRLHLSEPAFDLENMTTEVQMQERETWSFTSTETIEAY